MKRILLLLFVLLEVSCQLFGQATGNQAQRKKVAVLEVANADGDLKRGDLVMILGSLTRAVTRPGYIGYERRDVASILGEQNFQRSGMVNDDQIKRIGEMEGVQYVLASEVAQMSNGNWAITAKILDVESGAISQSAVIQTSMVNIEQGCQNLVSKLFGGGQSGASYGNGGYSSNATYGGQPASGVNYTEKVFDINMQMVYVEGGEFMMGCTSEQGRDCLSDEKNTHRVTLDGYYIGKFEVTQGQWEKVMGTSIYQQRDKANSSSSYGVGLNYPMYYVSWEEANAFCEELSRRTGKKYRLPTEAEWEYAARGGKKQEGAKYSGSSSLDIVAWYDGNSGRSTHPVGTKRDNLLGIYDMSGNVWEWCRDWYVTAYSYVESRNPQGPSGGYNRVIRGGGWSNGAQFCRVSSRSIGSPGYRLSSLGFRVVCEL